MKFPEHYFEKEERCGFLVDSMMKRAWAGQLEVLREIDRICKKYNIVYFAYWGTMLGAVRHQGFIPWDDDLDIAMTRTEYKRFLTVAERELPDGWSILNIYNDSDYDSLLSRVLNGRTINMNKEHLERFHGCPFVLGIDIFPLDYVPRLFEDQKIQTTLVSVAFGTASHFSAKVLSSEEEEELLQQVKEVCGVEIAHDDSAVNELYRLADRLCAMYEESEADCLALMPLFSDEMSESEEPKEDWTWAIPKECYEEVVWMPYENITIPVPKGYDYILTHIYGDYMTPVQGWDSHDYPFYKSQLAVLDLWCEENGVNREELLQYFEIFD